MRKDRIANGLNTREGRFTTLIPIYYKYAIINDYVSFSYKSLITKIYLVNRNISLLNIYYLPAMEVIAPLIFTTYYLN